jgi:DNA-binding CsgD family transcriptional regulator
VDWCGAFKQQPLDQALPELIQAAIEKLAQTAPFYWGVFDTGLQPLYIPPHAARFLNHVCHYPAEHLSEALHCALQRVSVDLPGSNTIHVDLSTPAGNLACHACMLEYGGHDRAWLLRFVPNGPTEDFDLLMRIGITAREAEILSYLPLGYANRDIADAMDITVNGVKKHLQHIGRKLGAGGRTEILYKALMKKREIALLEEIVKISGGDD